MDFRKGSMWISEIRRRTSAEITPGGSPGKRTIWHDPASRYSRQTRLGCIRRESAVCGSPPEVTIKSALDSLVEEGFAVLGVSRLYRTPCFPVGAGPDYVNAAAKLVAPATSDVAAILAALHRVEARFGRERLERWGRRTLDIDLLAVGKRSFQMRPHRTDGATCCPSIRLARCRTARLCRIHDCRTAPSCWCRWPMWRQTGCIRG